MNFEDFVLAKFDALLNLENTVTDFTTEQNAELDMLSAWYDVWLDYGQACSELRKFYEEKGINIPK